MTPTTNGAAERREAEALPSKKPDDTIDAGLRDLDHCMSGLHGANLYPIACY